MCVSFVGKVVESDEWWPTRGVEGFNCVLPGGSHDRVQFGRRCVSVESHSSLASSGL